MPPFRITHSQRVHEGRVVKLRVDTLEVSKGHTVQREVVEHRGAVVIAALNPEGRVLLVRQYRHAVGERLLELPAGTLEPNEEPLVTAIRELQEETGYYPDEIVPAGGFYSAPGFCDEYLHLFIARKLRPQSLEGDPDEDIGIEPIDLKRAPELISSGEIKDAKTIAGLYMLRILADAGG